MTITIETVHPSITVVKGGGRQFEIPTAAFPSAPQVGQTWELTIAHQPSPDEQAAKLNDYLSSD